MDKTPTTRQGLEQYDQYPALHAALMAWVNPGRAPQLHEYAQDEVRRVMPLLARALDRAAREVEIVAGDRVIHPAPAPKRWIPWRGKIAGL